MEEWFHINEKLPEDGVEVLAFCETESDHYGEADGTYILAFREEEHWVDSIQGTWIEDIRISYWKHLIRPAKR